MLKILLTESVGFSALQPGRVVALFFGLQLGLAGGAAGSSVATGGRVSPSVVCLSPCVLLRSSEAREALMAEVSSSWKESAVVEVR